MPASSTKNQPNIFKRFINLLQQKKAQLRRLIRHLLPNKHLADKHLKLDQMPSAFDLVSDTDNSVNDGTNSRSSTDTKQNGAIVEMDTLEKDDNNTKIHHEETNAGKVVDATDTDNSINDGTNSTSSTDTKQNAEIINFDKPNKHATSFNDTETEEKESNTFTPIPISQKKDHTDQYGDVSDMRNATSFTQRQGVLFTAIPVVFALFYFAHPILRRISTHKPLIDNAKNKVTEPKNAVKDGATAVATIDKEEVKAPQSPVQYVPPDACEDHKAVVVDNSTFKQGQGPSTLTLIEKGALSTIASPDFNRSGADAEGPHISQETYTRILNQVFSKFFNAKTIRSYEENEAFKNKLKSLVKEGVNFVKSVNTRVEQGVIDQEMTFQSSIKPSNKSEIKGIITLLRQKINALSIPGTGNKCKITIDAKIALCESIFMYILEKNASDIPSKFQKFSYLLMPYGSEHFGISQIAHTLPNETSKVTYKWLEDKIQSQLLQEDESIHRIVKQPLKRIETAIENGSLTKGDLRSNIAEAYQYNLITQVEHDQLNHYAEQKCLLDKHMRKLELRNFFAVNMKGNEVTSTVASTVVTTDYEQIDYATLYPLKRSKYLEELYLSLLEIKPSLYSDIMAAIATMPTSTNLPRKS